MKKTICLTIVSLAIASLALAQSQNVIFETIYLNPKTESIKELGEKIKSHNQKFHATAPYGASVWEVLTGPRSGDMFWVMGPFTFADLDKRPAEGGHDDDWSGNVLPLTNSMHDGSYWKLIPEFAYFPSENYQGKVMRVRLAHIKPGKMEEFRREMTRIMEVVNKNKPGNSFSIYNNMANDGDKDVAVVWQYPNYAYLDMDYEFNKKYEDMFGDNSWNEFQEAMNEIVISSSDELLERDAD